MVVSREGLRNFEKASHGKHELVEGFVAMVSRDSVVQGFPQTFDGVDPGMIGRLEQ